MVFYLKEIIVVEGKYDKIKLSGFIGSPIFSLDGFQIYKNEELIALLRRLAGEKGIVILTDSDSAGFRIRNFLKNKLSGCDVKHAFIPDIYGKEARKDKPSKEGKLGVEGIPDEIILNSLKAGGAVFINSDSNSSPHEKSADRITKLSLYKLGLYGGENSREKREALLKRLSLPSRLSPNMLLPVLNLMLDAGMIDRDVQKELLTHI